MLSIAEVALFLFAKLFMIFKNWNKIQPEPESQPRAVDDVLKEIVSRLDNFERKFEEIEQLKDEGPSQNLTSTNNETNREILLRLENIERRFENRESSNRDYIELDLDIDNF